ncbi:MAG: peptidase S8, partial [Deltaproteobacteria bacterium]|nr:peptidase S8 [Deltaproteobacteria bacterium]
SGSATFSANDMGGANGSNTLNGTLSGSGSGSVTVTNNVAETVTVAADATGDAEAVANVDDNVVFNPGAAAQLAFNVQPSDTATTVQISPAITVEVQDALGNLVTSATDTVTLSIGTNPASGTLSGTLARAAVTGVATFNDISIDKVGVGYTLNATAGGLTPAGSAAFAITAGAATQLVFTVQPSNSAVGGIILGTPSVAVQDAGGNTVTGDNSTQITIAIKPGTGTSSANLGGTLTLVVANGVADFTNLSIDLAGSGYVLTGTATGLTSGDSSSFDVNSILNLTQSDSS